MTVVLFGYTVPITFRRKARSMISKPPTARIFGLPVIIGMLSTPLYAATPDALGNLNLSSGASVSIELVYPRYAQVGGDDIGGGSNNDSSGNDNVQVPSGPSVAASNARTAQIVNQINQIQRICEFMGDEYKVACFATTYRELAQDIPANGDYEEAREVLLDTARKLDRLTRNNLDRNKPALSARIQTDSGQSVPTPPMRAVQADRASELNRQASNIVAEAETILLRSASSDATRAIHYQRIAAAVGSNKVLLRSS